MSFRHFSDYRHHGSLDPWRWRHYYLPKFTVVHPLTQNSILENLTPMTIGLQNLAVHSNFGYNVNSNRPFTLKPTYTGTYLQFILLYTYHTEKCFKQKPQIKMEWSAGILWKSNGFQDNKTTEWMYQYCNLIQIFPNLFPHIPGSATSKWCCNTAISPIPVTMATPMNWSLNPSHCAAAWLAYWHFWFASTFSSFFLLNLFTNITSTEIYRTLSK